MTGLFYAGADTVINIVCLRPPGGDRTDGVYSNIGKY